MPVLSKPVAIHLHLFYTELWGELCCQIKNLGDTPYKLFVTLVTENQILQQQIKAFCPDAEILIVPNMGYDVGPFIEFLNHINLDDYSYLLKLHSKHPTKGVTTKFNYWPVSRKYWKILLSEALIGSPRIWQKNLRAFETDSKLGMIGSPALIKANDHTDIPFIPIIEEQLQKMGLSLPPKFSFVAGTMFLARSSLFKVIQHQYRIEDFQITDGEVRNGTLAHVFERLFGAIVYAQGFKLNGFHWNWKFLIDSSRLILLRFLYQKKISKNNKMTIKICKIPFFSKKI